MTATQTPRLALYRWSADSDSFTRLQMDTSHANIESRAGGFYAGASLPTPSTQYERSVFLNTATSKLFFFAGTDENGSWIALNDFIDNTTRDVSVGNGTATTLNKVTITAPATGATLTLANNSSLVTSGSYSITLTSTNTTSVTLPTGGTLSTLAGVETLTNKSLSDATSFVIEAADASRKAKFSASLISSSTTRTFTFPDVNGTIITTGDTASVTNTMINAVDYSKVTGLQTWGDGRYYTETEVNSAYIYQWAGRPSGGVITNARQIYIQADAPVSAQDGDLWFDL